MKRLLFAYDGSDCSNAALDDLGQAGLPTELHVKVLCVAEVLLPLDRTAETPDQGRLSEAIRQARRRALELVEAADQKANHAVERLGQLYPRWRLAAVTAVGSPVRTLVDAATEWHADLMVVGSHGRSVVGQLFLGSVAHGVAAAAPCSLHIARPRPHPHSAQQRVLVAVDGSMDSNAAVRAVAARNWRPGTQVQTVTVIDPGLETSGGLPTLYAQEWIQQHDANASEWVCRFVAHAKDLLSRTGLTVETHIFAGHPKTVLLKHAEAWAADCIFVGARGLDHGNRCYLGSTASALASRAHCSVEIVRETTSKR